MNWLDAPVEPPNAPPPQDPDAPSESTLNYWAARLTPLHDPTPDYAELGAADGAEIGGKEVIFVGCNRVGTEEGTLICQVARGGRVGADTMQGRPSSGRAAS